MSNFTSARVKLTLWYIAIVAIVGFAFSAIVYQIVTSEIERSFQMAEFHLRNGTNIIVPRRIALEILKDDLDIAKRSVLIRLIQVNGIIIAASGIAAFALAGKTLKPLEKVVEEQKRFTADASHELKTPLTALRTELEVSLRDKRLTLKDTKKILKSNLEEVISLQKLSENLVRLTRHSQNNIKFSQLNIKEVVSGAVKKVSPMAKKKSIKIKQEVSLTSVNGDKESLEELFVILLDNAIKYSPEKSKVKIVSERKRGKNIIKVSDHGVGIAKKDIPNLFNRFYRAEASRNKEEVSGYGLGLSIAKHIVERHKGSISVKSEVNLGSTFKIDLPV
jgi:signal transduction histidine kinase